MTSRWAGRRKAASGIQDPAAEPVLQAIDEARFLAREALMVHEAPVALVEGEGLFGRDPPVGAVPGELAQRGPPVKVEHGFVQEGLERFAEARGPRGGAKALGVLARQAKLHLGHAGLALAQAVGA